MEDGMYFWLSAISLAGLVAGLLIVALLRRQNAIAPAQAHDLAIYRDQLDEVERDRARGVISDTDLERTRAEVSRRILDADRALQASGGSGRAPRWLTLAVGCVTGVLILGGTASLYLAVGAPGTPDQPLAARLAAAKEARADRRSQQAAEAERQPIPPPTVPDAEHVELVERLRAVIAQRPKDRQGLALLARHEGALGNYPAAYAAQRRLIEVKGEAATSADYTDLAGYLIRAAGGYVSPAAERALAKALRLDDANGAARYYAGLLDAQTGRPDRAFRQWRALLEASPTDAPWVAPIRAGIEEIARRAGMRYTLPEKNAAPAPSPQAMAAMRDRDPAERRQTIRGMVSGLAERLSSEGGSVNEWLRLIRAYRVLGETEKRLAAIAEAQAAFQGNETALSRLHEAAAGPTGQARGDSEIGRLAARLAQEGGGPSDWARLIAMLAGADRTGRARAVWQEAQQVFANTPAALAPIRAAARAAGLAP